jgi:rare lipoprotein A
MTVAQPASLLAGYARDRDPNVATGRSVIVRVNDRGPFIPGRIVDVSYSADTTLGMVAVGIAKVKLEVLE